MSVKMSIGPQPCPWVLVEPGVTLPPPGRRVLIMASASGTGRIRIGIGYRGGVLDGWVMQTTTTVAAGVKIVAIIPEGEAVDVDRTHKAAYWVEKHFGALKVKNSVAWWQEFLKAWGEKPWA
jgi:hypothetical protein